MRLFSTSLAFSNRTSSNRNHCLWLLYGRKLNVKVPVLQAWFSLQYTNVEYSTVADRAIKWGTVFPFLSRERKMSLWKMVIYWAAMDGLSGAGKTPYLLHSWQPQDKSVLFEQGLKNGVAEQESTVPGEEKLPRSCQYAACFSGSVCLSSICRVHRYLASVSNAILLLGIKFCSQKIGMWNLNF